MTNRNKIVLVGLNFRTASLEEQQKFQISRKLLQKVLPELKANSGFEGIVILSTCN